MSKNERSNLEALAAFFKRIVRRKVQRSFLQDMQATFNLKSTVQNEGCPACSQKTLILTRFTHTPTAWDAEVACSNCNLQGIINSEGFVLFNVGSKGKAVDKKKETPKT